MKTEGPANQREKEITKFSRQRNDDIKEIAPPGNGSLMDNDDNEFNYVNQDNIKLKRVIRLVSVCTIPRGDCP